MILSSGLLHPGEGEQKAGTLSQSESARGVRCLAGAGGRDRSHPHRAHHGLCCAPSETCVPLTQLFPWRLSTTSSSRNKGKVEIINDVLASPQESTGVCRVLSFLFVLCGSFYYCFIPIFSRSKSQVHFLMRTAGSARGRAGQAEIHRCVVLPCIRGQSGEGESRKRGRAGAVIQPGGPPGPARPPPSHSSASASVAQRPVWRHRLWRHGGQ